METQSDVRFQIPRDVWLGLGGIVLAGAYWWKAARIPISPLDGAVNAAAIPMALAYAMVLFSTILILRAIAIEMMFVRAAKAARTGKKAARPKEAGAHYFSAREHLRAAGVIGIGIIYLLLLPRLGYVLSITALFFAMSVYMGAKVGAYTAALAVGIAVFFYLLFVQVLGIPLPAGIWVSLLP